MKQSFVSKICSVLINLEISANFEHIMSFNPRAVFGLTLYTEFYYVTKNVMLLSFKNGFLKGESNYYITFNDF